MISDYMKEKNEIEQRRKTRIWQILYIQRIICSLALNNERLKPLGQNLEELSDGELVDRMIKVSAMADDLLRDVARNDADSNAKILLRSGNYS